MSVGIQKCDRVKDDSPTSGQSSQRTPARAGGRPPTPPTRTPSNQRLRQKRQGSNRQLKSKNQDTTAICKEAPCTKHIMREELDGLVERYQQSLQGSHNHENDQKIALMLNKIGNVFFRHSHLDDALQFYEDAFLHASTANLLAATSSACHNMAIVHYRQGDFASAMREFGRALDAGRRQEEQQEAQANTAETKEAEAHDIDPINHVMETVQMLHHIHKRRGEDDAAERLQQESMKLFRDCGVATAKLSWVAATP